MKRNSLTSVFFIFALGLVVLTGCSEDQKIDAVQVDGDEGIVDPKLFGKWAGEIDGDLGTENITMSLDGDGSITTTSSTDLYCTIAGTWEVVGKNFEAKGEDNCDGTIINLTAPNSTTKLEGGWAKADGSKGTFAVTKE